jgi:hypothetical protein
MSDPQRGAPAARTPSKLPGVLVLVGASAVLVGTTFLPWMVGDVTRFLSKTGDNQRYASLAFFGVSIVGGIVGLAMLPGGSNARLALVAILLALLAGGLIFIDYEAFSRRVARYTSGSYTAAGVYTSVGWKVAVGPGPYVSGVGAIVWIIGALVDFARRRPGLARRVDVDAAARPTARPSDATGDLVAHPGLDPP